MLGLRGVAVDSWIWGFFLEFPVENKFSFPTNPVCQLGVPSIQWQVCDRPSC